MLGGVCAHLCVCVCVRVCTCVRCCGVGLWWRPGGRGPVSANNPDAGAEAIGLRCDMCHWHGVGTARGPLEEHQQRRAMS